MTDRHVAMVVEAIRDWVHEEHPGHGDLAERAGRIAARLFAEGATLGEVCRATYAYVEHHSGVSSAGEAGPM